MDYLETFENNNYKFGLRLMDNYDDNEIKNYIDLFYEAFGFRENVDKSDFNWFNISNPLGSCNNYLLIELVSKKIIGTYGFMKLSYNNKSINYIGSLGVNSMIGKYFRGYGLSVKLLDYALKYELKDSFCFSFPHGSNIPTIKSHIRTGWTQLNTLNFYANYNFFDFQDNNLIRIVDKQGLEKIRIDSFDHGKEFYFYKSPEWLNWRFLQRPYKEYYIIGSLATDNTFDGYMVLGFYKTKDLKRCQIIDYGCVDNNILKNMLLKAGSVALEMNSNILDILISDSSEDLPVILNMKFEKTMTIKV